ncbi:MAG: hypothetical protein ACRDH6_04035 [Actinomycetota bacterium]
MQSAREPAEDRKPAVDRAGGAVVPLQRRQQTEIRALLAQAGQRHEQLSREIRRIESAVRRLAEILKLVIRGPVGAEGADPVISLTDGQAGRLESALGHLASRIAALSQALEDERERQERDVTAFIERTREGLVGVAGRLRDGLGELTRRQGESQERLRKELRGEIESLKRAIPNPAEGNGDGHGAASTTIGEATSANGSTDDGGGGHEEGDLVAVAGDFATKLGGIKERLSELSVEIAADANGARNDGAATG